MYLVLDHLMQGTPSVQIHLDNLTTLSYLKNGMFRKMLSHSSGRVMSALLDGLIKMRSLTSLAHRSTLTCNLQGHMISQTYSHIAEMAPSHNKYVSILKIHIHKQMVLTNSVKGHSFLLYLFKLFQSNGIGDLKKSNFILHVAYLDSPLHTSWRHH